MKKKKLTQNTEILNLKKDLGLEQDITVAFWKDPSRTIIFDLISIISDDDAESLSDEEKEKKNFRYFECASLMLVDSDVPGLSFDTPEKTMLAFDDERIPWGTFHQALLMYLAKLTDDYQVLKNALRRAKKLSSSGNEEQETQENQ